MLPSTWLATLGLTLIALLIALILRLLFIAFRRRCIPKRSVPARTLIVLGSGGHTAEMLTIVAGLDAKRYRPRIYVCADTDKLSANAAQRLESARDASDASDVSIHRVQRSRHVHQSYASAVRTTAQAFVCDALLLMWREQPDLVLCNGPGTCVPLAVAAWLLRLCGRLAANSRIVFVESFCRVRSVSLSGRLLRPLADLFVVQWMELQQSGDGEYLGQLM